MTALLWLLIAVPGGVGLLLLAAGRRADRVAGPVAVFVAGLVLAGAVVGVAGVRARTELAFFSDAPLSLRIDSLAGAVAVTVAAVAALVLVVALREIATGRWRFYALMLVFLAAVLLTVFADSVPALLAGWEVMGASSYALIAFEFRDPASVGAGGTAFLTTRTADLGLYLAAGAALAGTAQASTHAGNRLSLSSLAALPSPWLHVAASGVLVAALGKAAQLPFSFWLSGAMRGPSPVSALLHSAAMVAMGGYLLLRLRPLLSAAGWAATTATWVGAVTGVAMGAVAVFQRDLKQLLAASTSAQLGYVVLAAGITVHGGAVSAGLAQLVAHAATKALLFLAAGIWLQALGTKQLPGLVGAARLWPVVGASFTIGALSLAGVPPLSLWAAKDSVLAAARAQSLPLYLTGLGGALLAAAYAGKAVGIALRPVRIDASTGWDAEQRGTRTVSVLEKAPLLVLATAAVLLGVLELPPVARRIADALGQRSPISPSWGELAASSVLAVTAALAAAWAGNRIPSPAWAVSWLGTTAVPRAVTMPLLRLARALARVDDHGIDRAVIAAATWTRSAATLAARVDERGIDAAVDALARGTRRLGVWALRPQTGQVHQYYAQAAVLLAAAVALLAIVR